MGDYTGQYGNTANPNYGYNVPESNRNPPYESNFQQRRGGGNSFRGHRGGGPPARGGRSGGYDHNQSSSRPQRGGMRPNNNYDSRDYDRSANPYPMDQPHQNWSNDGAYSAPYNDPSHNPNSYGGQYEQHQSPKGRGYDNQGYGAPGGFNQNYNAPQNTGGQGRKGGRPPDPAPNTSVMFRGLDRNTTEEKLMDYVKPFGQVVSVKVIMDRASGQSRGIAFAEFQNLSDAKAFYDAHKQPDNPNSHKIVIDGANVDLKYSRPHTNHTTPTTDWVCPKCQINNFAKRTECFQCAAPRPVATAYPPVEQGAVSTLSILNLNTNTTKQTLVNTFQQYSPVKSCRLLWDKTRNISRGTAFIEFHSVEEANHVLNSTQGLSVDGYHVRVSFARHNNSDSGQFDNDPSDRGNIPHGGSLGYGSNPGYGHSDSPYGTQPYSDSLGGSAPYDAPPVSVSPLDGIPDAADYGYDESSGYYFNPKIHYYFDPKTQFFYDLNERQFYYYDRIKREFIRHEVPTESSDVSQSQSNTTPPNTSRPNESTNYQQYHPSAASHQTGAGYNTSEVPPQNSTLASPLQSSSPTAPPAPTGDLVPGSPLFESLRAQLEQTTGLICSLCKRRLPTTEALLKHNQLSALHKTNLQDAVNQYISRNNLSTDGPDNKVSNSKFTQPNESLLTTRNRDYDSSLDENPAKYAKLE